MVEQNNYSEQLVLWKDEQIFWKSFSPEVREEVKILIGKLLMSELLKNRKENCYGEE